MNEFYISYYCKKCRKSSVLVMEEVHDTLRNRNYISCPHCGSKKMNVEFKVSDLRKCMDNSAYKRIKGKIRQIH